MSARSLASGLAPLVGGAALYLLALPASAIELSIYRSVMFDQHQPGVSDYSSTGGGSCTTCLSLESGIDLAANEYTATYEHDPVPFPAYTTQSNFTGTTGGRVSYGVIQGSAGGSLATTEVNDDRFYTEFRGSWNDSVTITNPALTGQPGILYASVLVEFVPTTSVVASPVQTAENWGVQLDWRVASNGSGSANFYQLELDDGGVLSQYFDYTGANLSPAPWTVTVPFSYSFTFGDPFELGVDFAATAQGGGPGSNDVETQEWQASANLNFLNTLAWQGISNLTDAEGNPVEFSLQSESATDWTQAATVVPLPATVWLLMSGLASLGLRRRG